MDVRYLLVDIKALPKVFPKVVEAKQLMMTGKAHTAAEASRIAGISRSAFYKYKDLVYPFNGHGGGRIITIYSVLRDLPGVLSRLTAEFYRAGANILTVNQNIPIGGVAPVSISARVDNMSISVDDLLAILRDLDGVENIEIFAGA